MKSIEVSLSEAIDALTAGQKEKFLAWQKDHKNSPIEVQLNACEVMAREAEPQKIRRHNGISHTFAPFVEDGKQLSVELAPDQVAKFRSYMAMGFTEAEVRKVLDLPDRQLTDMLSETQARQFTALTKNHVLTEAEALLMVSPAFDQALKKAIKKGKNAREFFNEVSQQFLREVLTEQHQPARRGPRPQTLMETTIAELEEGR